MMMARGGDIASVDVVVPAKNTGIAPGPMLTEFKEAGIPTKIDQGTIWIAKDSTPVLKGEAINEKLAAILGKLDIKPVEAGITLFTALEDGLKYAEEEMIIDVEKVRDNLHKHTKKQFHYLSRQHMSHQKTSNKYWQKQHNQHVLFLLNQDT